MAKKPNATTTQPEADASPRARIALHAGADGIAVVFPPERNPGVENFGVMKAGVEYIVAPPEALRLTSHKRAPGARFDFATDADAQRAADFTAAPAAKE